MSNQDQVNETLIREMVKVSLTDLENINKYGLKAMAKDIAKRMLRRGASNKDILFWPAGALLLGLCSALDKLPEEDSLSEEISRKLRLYINTWAEVTDESFEYVDDSLSGVSILKLSETADKDVYLKYADKLYNFLSGYPKSNDISIIYNKAAGNDYVFADGVGQTAMFLCRFGSIMKNKDAFKLGMSQLKDFAENGFDKKSNLPYHAFSGKKSAKLGLLGWGRACGWLMLGYSECLSSSKAFANDMNLKKDIEDVRKKYLSLSKVLLDYQRKDGGFSWHIPAVEGAADTSASSMIAYSWTNALSAEAFGAEAPTYKKAVLRVKDFIINNTENGSVSQSLSSCEDIGVHRQIFEHNAWGQGFSLAFLSILP